MITINVEDFNMEITQESYDEIINNIDRNRLCCPKCNHFDMVIHGYYDRPVKTKDGIIRIVIVRVKCKSCDCTHALLLSSIVPYGSVTLKDQIRIVKNDELDSLLSDNPFISFDDVSRIKRNYKLHYLERLRSFSIKIDKDIVSNCFLAFKRQFLQISCRSNILYT